MRLPRVWFWLAKTKTGGGNSFYYDYLAVIFAEAYFIVSGTEHGVDLRRFLGRLEVCKKPGSADKSFATQGDKLSQKLLAGREGADGNVGSTCEPEEFFKYVAELESVGKNHLHFLFAWVAYFRLLIHASFSKGRH